jgi:hypothetical protein
VALLALYSLAAWQAGGAGARARTPTATTALRIERMDQLPSGPRARGALGDVLLRNDRIAAVVTAPRVVAGKLIKPGVLVDAFPLGKPDHLQEVTPSLVVGGSGDPEPIVAQRVAPARLQGHAAVVAEATLQTHGTRLEVVTTFQVRPGEDFVRIETVVRNRGAVAVTTRLGDRLYFGNSPPFASGLGWVNTDITDQAGWIGQRVDGYAYAWAAEDPARLGTHFNYETIVESFYQGDTVPATAAALLPPGRSQSFKRRFHVVAGDFAQAHAAVLKGQGKPTGTLAVDIAGRELPGLKLRVESRQGALVIEHDPRLAVSELALEPGDYQVRLEHQGVRGPATPVSIAAGATQRLALSAPSAQRLQIEVVDDHTREPLFARVVLTGLGPTATPWLGPEDQSDGGADTVYARRTGGAQAVVPTGRYRLMATRGPEYTLGYRDIGPCPGPRAAAGRPIVESCPKVELPLRRVVDTRGWVAADLHLHAIGSPDSHARLEDRVISLVSEGIELAVATDHNQVTDYGPAVQRTGAGQHITTLIGDEVTTRGFKFGHFNVFPLPRDPSLADGGALPYNNTTPRALFEAAARINVPGVGRPVMQVNHPRMPPDIGYFDQVGFDPVRQRASDSRYDGNYDAIEVFNGTDLSLLGRVEQNLREWMALLDHGHRYTATGNSDSHRMRYEAAGYPRNYVRLRRQPLLGDDPRSSTSDRPGQIDPSQVVAAIKRGQVVVTNGPFLEAEILGAGPGDLARLPPAPAGRPRTVPLRIRLQAAPWIDVATLDIYQDGRRVDTVHLTSGGATTVRYDGTRQLPVSVDGWVVVVARGRRTFPDRLLPFNNVVALAFTNPIWIDADGDGKVGSRSVRRSTFEERR